jgi:putative membrane protein
MNQGVKTVLIIGGTIIAVLVILSIVLGTVFGWQGSGYGMMGGMMGGFGSMGLMSIIWLLVIGLIIWALAASVRGSDESKSSDSSRPDSAFEILKKRYARGEINKEEYNEKSKELI